MGMLQRWAAALERTTFLHVPPHQSYLAEKLLGLQEDLPPCPYRQAARTLKVNSAWSAEKSEDYLEITWQMRVACMWKKNWGKEFCRDRAFPPASFVISVQISVANKLTVMQAIISFTSQ